MTLPWRFGVNMRSFAYYERRDWLMYPQGQPPNQDEVLHSLKDLNTSLVRFYAVNRNASINDNLHYVGQTLDKIRNHGMQAIICIMDGLETPFVVPGDQGYYKGNLQKQYWHNRAYQANYLPYVRQLVERFRNHPAAAIWELGNEFGIYPNHPAATVADWDVFVEFAHTAARVIKQIAPGSLVSTGLINTNHVIPHNPGPSTQMRENYARQLHSSSDIDLASIHVYPVLDGQDALSAIDAQIARSLGKDFFVGELGANIRDAQFGGNRTNYFREKMNLWRQRGAFTVLPWDYDIVRPPQDSGVADDTGFNARHPDFHSIHGMIKKEFSPHPIPSPHCCYPNASPDCT